MIVISLGMFLLTACIPRGDRNWLFSIEPQTNSVALGDLDNDGDQDAFLANGENEVPVPDTVWLNDGKGHFQNRGQQIAEYESHSVTLADMDADGNLDAVTGGTNTVGIYFNNEQAVFIMDQARLTILRDLSARVASAASLAWLVPVAGCSGRPPARTPSAPCKHPVGPMTQEQYRSHTQSYGFFIQAPTLPGKSLLPSHKYTAQLVQGPGSCSMNNHAIMAYGITQSRRTRALTYAG